MVYSLTRRELALGLTGMAVSLPLVGGARAATPLTAADIVERIKARCAREGVAWRAETVDTFKMGDPQTRVKGIVTTFMATSALIRHAAAAGANMIVSHEPIYWNHLDKTDTVLEDPVYQAKVALGKSLGMVVWRFHDHFHGLKPEPMSEASTEAWGWKKYLRDPNAGFSRIFERPPISLRDLVAELKTAMPSRSLRVIGKPDMMVQRIGSAGHDLDGVINGLNRADVVIVPEIREYDSGEYVRDLVALGEPKAMILIAHERGEEDGMNRCASWLKTFVTEVPVRFISSQEPFWSPGSPAKT